MSIHLHLVRLSSPVELFSIFHSLDFLADHFLHFLAIILASLVLLPNPPGYCETIQLLSFFTSRHKTLNTAGGNSRSTPLRGRGGHCNISDFKEVPSTTQYWCYICVCEIFFHNGNFKPSPLFLNIWLYHPAFPQQLAFH